MIEGSGSGSVPLTGSSRPKHIRIHNTDLSNENNCFAEAEVPEQQDDESGDHPGLPRSLAWLACR
jgi:hypothetical protein